ncbi:MAG: ATP-binding cassette domain-containing protein [Rhizobiales bacterium]|nr:ATP-binding cassette domain-containing protein [Hyphomicrobiales bacterium]
MHDARRTIPDASSQGVDVSNRSVAVKVERLVMSFGTVHAVGGIGFDVVPGSTVTLLGPSGCGKTTTLRCIAGLEMPTAGRITVGGHVVFDGENGIFIEPERRNIGMVFQSYAIWPHMTVGGNVGFPLAISGVPKRQAEERTRAVLDLVGLGELQGRSAADLSGGQQQRVALARALVHEPRVVLFDEPLSNLDANLRERMRTELQLLQSRLGFTAIFVTHDQEEALSLSDHIVIMNKGLIEQTGTPQDIFKNPETAFTARFLGYSNVFPGRLAAIGDAGSVAVDLGEGRRLSARWRSRSPPRQGADCTIAFRADRVALMPANDPAGGNAFPGVVETVAFLGTCFDYTITSGAVQVQAEGPVDHPVARGQAVSVAIAPEHCHAFAAED